MPKTVHEIRDSIHVFVRLDGHERELMNAWPFQRLRHIHQLALTYLVYPGATHKRFEHSLGVMELAGRVFDIVTKPENVSDEMRSVLAPLNRPDELRYWRRVLRVAALCHDLGHLPFSHAAESELLPEGWDHERITREIINSDYMRPIWERATPPLRTDDIVKLAVGPQKAVDHSFSEWESILSEIIVGDAFGVDRMDYLLRDSHHVGVAYGKFEHYRLIDTLRLLSASASGGAANAALGVEEGGVQSAEALMLARCFMFSQVYLHPVRRIYDIHLKEFLKEWLPTGLFPTDVASHPRQTDNELTGALVEAAFDAAQPGHVHARRIIDRDHFKLLYERNSRDIGINPEAGQSIYTALCAKFGDEHFRHDRYHQESGSPDFPVMMRSGELVSSLEVSETLRTVPAVSVDHVFCDRSVFSEAQEWLNVNHATIVLPAGQKRSRERITLAGQRP